MSMNVPVSSSSSSSMNIDHEPLNQVGAATAAAVAATHVTTRNQGLGIPQWMHMHRLMMLQKITLRYMYNFTVEERITAIIKEIVSGTQTYNFVY